MAHPRYQTNRGDVHPGANQHLGFQSGKGYYAAAGRIVPGPGKTASRPHPNADPMRALVNQLISAQTAPLTTAEQQRQQQADRQRMVLSQAQNQLIQYLSAGTQPAAQAYDSAIQQTNQLGLNAAALLKGQNPTNSDLSLLKSIGAPQSQQDQLAAANDARFNQQGGVLYAQGAGIPGQSLAAGKAANASYLASLPTVAALSGNQAASALQNSSNLAHQDYLSRLAQIRATYPQLYQQLASQAQSYAQKQSALDLNSQIAQQSLGLRQSNLDLSQQRVANQSAQFNARQGQQNDQFNARQSYLKQKDATSTAAKATAKATAAANARKKTFYSARAKAFTKAQSLYNGPSAASGGVSYTTGGASSGQSYQRPSYQKAYTKLWNIYGPALISAGVRRKAVQQMLRNALQNAGYSPLVDVAQQAGAIASGGLVP